MNKFHVFCAALAAVVMAACAPVEKEQEPEVIIPDGYKLLTIQAAQAGDTRTAYSGEVVFSWNEGDRISVLCHEGTNNFWQTFTADQAGAVSTFTALVSDDTVIGAVDGTKAALYPADEHHVYNSASDMSFNIPAVRDFRAGEGGHKETAIPMFAWGDSNDTFAFANMTGAVKFTFSNIPSTTTQVKMVFENTCHLKLNGLYPLEMESDEEAADVAWSAASSDESAENSVTYYADVEDGVARFYLPYAAGSLWAWNHLTLSDASTDAALFSNTKVGQINVTKNRIVVLPTLDVLTGGVEAGLTSAYGIDWTIIPSSANSSSDYMAIKSMKATADDDYLYVYLEVNPDMLDKTHTYDHYLKVFVAGASGSNSWWSDQNNVSKIGNSAWAVANGEISYSDFGSNPSDCNYLAAANTWYYEIRMSRATNAAITDPGVVNIGVILDDTYYDGAYKHLQGDVPYGVIPTYGEAMYPVTLPGETTFSYDSAYGLDWSTVEVAENASTTSYPILKSLRAQADLDYLYLLIEADSNEMETDPTLTYAHRFNLYAGSWSTGLGEQSWALKNGAADYVNWQSGYSDVSTNTTDADSWFYEIRLSRTHEKTLSALGDPGTVNIGVKIDNRTYGSGTYGYAFGGTSTMTLGKLPSSDTDLYPVVLPGTDTPSGSLNFNQNYTESSDNIANPERGLYRFIEYKYRDPDYNNQAHPAASYSLTDPYDSENTLLLATFYLFDYVDGGTISDDALTYIRNVFTNIRASGKKAIVRFGYSDAHVEDKTVDPRTIHQEPPKATILSHIAQIKPILTDFEDVILVGQAGFIGTYGEWYYTTYFSNFTYSNGKWSETRDWSYDSSSDKVTGFDDRYDVLTAVLDAFPSSRQVEVRTPAYKQFYISPNKVSNWTTLNDNNGFGTDPVNRLAFHNDAFLYGGSDLGTFHYDYEKAMWQQQGEYLICGGEAPYSSTSITEMDGYTWSNVPAGVYNNHYTYLHHDTAYPSGSSGGSTLFRYWYEQGWIPAIKKMLGYRLYLSNVTVSGTGQSGSTLSVSFTLKNSGAARVINERPMKLVLLHDGTPYVLSEDCGNVRLVPSGTVSGTSVTPGSKQFNVQVTLNRTIVDGDQLALWLPDQDPKSQGLQERAVYSIRLANNETAWTSGGYNVFYTVSSE